MFSNFNNHLKSRKLKEMSWILSPNDLWCYILWRLQNDFKRKSHYSMLTYDCIWRRSNRIHVPPLNFDHSPFPEVLYAHNNFQHRWFDIPWHPCTTCSASRIPFDHGVTSHRNCRSRDVRFVGEIHLMTNSNPPPQDNLKKWLSLVRSTDDKQ